jgi:hypothetical protein
MRRALTVRLVALLASAGAVLVNGDLIGPH